MSQFVTDLWESIFTPGPTPSLLIATNATFAALQIVLASLLFATKSIHFVILSILSGSLWWAINWFARELKEGQEREMKEAAKLAERTAGRGEMGGAQIPQTTDEDTEVEGSRSTQVAAKRRKGQSTAAAGSAATSAEKARDDIGVGASQGVDSRPNAPDLRFRDVSMAGASQDEKSSASTEDEWEKVSENESERTK